MKYDCVGCGKEVELDLKVARKVQCPFCGYRIITKKRPDVPKRVLAV